MQFEITMGCGGPEILFISFKHLLQEWLLIKLVVSANSNSEQETRDEFKNKINEHCHHCLCSPAALASV